MRCLVGLVFLASCGTEKVTCYPMHQPGDCGGHYYEHCIVDEDLGYVTRDGAGLTCEEYTCSPEIDLLMLQCAKDAKRLD